MRRRGRNANADVAHRMEEQGIIAQSPQIHWVFYTGAVGPGTIAYGYDVRQHEGWCIPLALHREKESLSENKFLGRVADQARKIKFRDDGVLKTNFNDTEKWWVVAPPPDSRPVYGYIVRAQPADRSGVMGVPASSSATSGDPMQRLDQLAKKRKKDTEDQNLAGKDDIWIGGVRFRSNGGIELYPVDDPKPLITMNRQGANIKTESTKFDHDPDQTSYQSHSVSPNAKDLPSTNTIPVQTFTPSNPDFLMIASLAIAVAKYVSGKTDRDKNKRTSEHIEHPIEYIDYEDLRRDM